jgi:hypothetical protein
MTEATQTKTARRHTSMGTPCSPAWDSDWIAAVETREREVGHRICGARTLAGTPCALKPNHKNGRCKYHGGFNLTGAQPGNRNAVIHGLYARGLARCGKQCPMWESCPCAGDEVAELPAKERPICPYEKTQYDAAVTDTLPRVPATVCGEPHPFYRHLAHQLALLQVMMTRAGAAMALNADSLPSTEGEEKAGTQRNGQPVADPHLTAFLRISSEYRRYVKLAEAPDSGGMSNTGLAEQCRRSEHDTSLEPEHQAGLDQTTPLADQYARTLLKEVEATARSPWPNRAHAVLDQAMCVSPRVARPHQAELQALINNAVTGRPAPT